MDKMQSSTIPEDHDTADESLPAVTASLELLTVDTNLPYPERKRATRRKTICIDPNESLNRRCSLRPRKRSCTENEKNDKQNKTQEVDVKNYYLNKNLKRKLNTLETIYEEKDDASENDCKLKKRRARIKKVFGLNVSFKRRCASMQMLLDKLNSIRAETSTKIDNEAK
ncbi:uncharacterized protein LOC144474051 isoform X2 [Augochlora pura]